MQDLDSANYLAKSRLATGHRRPRAVLASASAGGLTAVATAPDNASVNETHLRGPRRISETEPGLAYKPQPARGVRSCGHSSNVCIANIAWLGCRKCGSTNCRTDRYSARSGTIE